VGVIRKEVPLENFLSTPVGFLDFESRDTSHESRVIGIEGRAMKTKSNIERILESGGFVVTSECGPPRGADPEVIRKKGVASEGGGGCGQCDRQSDLSGEDEFPLFLFNSQGDGV